MQIGSTHVDSAHITWLSSQVNDSSQEVVQHLESPWGRILNFFVKHFSSSLPEWAEHHIALIHKLQQAILEAKSSTPTAIPHKVVQSLSQGRKILHRMMPQINYDLYLQCIKPKGHFVDKQGLLTASSPQENGDNLADSKVSWYQNLGLMMHVYKPCQDVQLKKKIAFLAFNYLAKSAPICPEDPNISKEAKRKLGRLFQRCLPEPGISYNRESALFDGYFRDALTQIFAPSSGNVFFLLDNPEIEELLPLGFSVIKTPSKNTQESLISFEAISEAWISGFYDKIIEHTAKHVEAPLDQGMDPPLLIDLTFLLDKHIYTSNQENKNQAFQQRLQEIEDYIEKALQIAIHKHVQDENLRQKLKVWALANLTCICRCEVHGVGVIKLLPLFYQPKHMLCPPGEQQLLGYRQNDPENLARVLLDHKHTKSKIDMDNFLNATGLRLGSIKGRMKTFEALSLEDFVHSHHGIPVEYYPQGANSLYFPGRLELFKSPLWKRWEWVFNAYNPKGKQLIEKTPYVKVLGKATLKLLKGLIQEISDERWRQMNQDPPLRELIQSSLYKIQVHLASAELHRWDFSKFTDEIELIHYEIATLLYLLAPFKAADFQNILKTSVGATLPKELRKFVKAGITKSAMNTVAGLCVAVNKTTTHPVKAYHAGSHFEIVQLLHPDSSLESQVVPKNLKRVDMYLGEFHHNVKLLYNHDEYQPGDVIGEVEPWLQSMPEGQHLTVAIDSTIDFIQSPHAQKVLEHFSQAIQDGKLLVVFFRSGQKFDMLGMDDYYGSPFYMIHNGAKHWEAFHDLLSKEAYQTDELSTQWFCVAYKYIREELDAYRQLIFQNTRAILRQVPNILLPGGNAQIKVAKVAEGMHPCFLDIKCYGTEAYSLIHKLERLLFDIFTRHNLKIHARGGYGYFNPNVCLFPKGLDHRDDYATLRINPGIEAGETELFVEFLKEAAKLVAS